MASGSGEHLRVRVGGALRVRVGGACGPPPPVAAPLASSLRAPSRGDPPHDGPSAAGDARTAYHAAPSVQRLTPKLHSPYSRCPALEGGQHVRGGSPRKRVRSELASGATSGGGGPQVYPVERACERSGAPPTRTRYGAQAPPTRTQCITRTSIR